MLLNTFTTLALAFQVLAAIVGGLVILLNLRRPGVIVSAVVGMVLVIGALGSVTWAPPLFNAIIATVTDLL